MDFNNIFSIACWDNWRENQVMDLWDFGAMYCAGGEL